jgi:hypothetical protein
MYCKCFGKRLVVLSHISPNYLITYGCYTFILTSPDAILRYDACALVGLTLGEGTVKSLCKMTGGFTRLVRDIIHLNRIHANYSCILPFIFKFTRKFIGGTLF